MWKLTTVLLLTQSIVCSIPWRPFLRHEVNCKHSHPIYLEYLKQARELDTAHSSLKLLYCVKYWKQTFIWHPYDIQNSRGSDSKTLLLLQKTGLRSSQFVHFTVSSLQLKDTISYLAPLYYWRKTKKIFAHQFYFWGVYYFLNSYRLFLLLHFSFSLNLETIPGSAIQEFIYLGELWFFLGL